MTKKLKKENRERLIKVIYFALGFLSLIFVVFGNKIVKLIALAIIIYGTYNYMFQKGVFDHENKD